MAMHPRERVDELVREEREAGDHIPQHVTTEEDAVTTGAVGGLSILAVIAGGAAGALIGWAVLAPTELAWWAGIIIGAIVGMVAAGIVVGRLSLNSVAPISYERRNDRKAGPPAPRTPRVR